VPGQPARRVRGADRGNGPPETMAPRPGPTPFKPVSYGFRPRRRAQDAIAEIVYFGSKGYQWVLDADITACFDELAHCALLERVRRRIADKRVLALIKAFLKAGIMSEGGKVRTRPPVLPRVV
jgi:RNA-directed DNA polymerase